MRRIECIEGANKKKLDDLDRLDCFLDVSLISPPPYSGELPSLYDMVSLEQRAAKIRETMFEMRSHVREARRARDWKAILGACF